jgi:hypothetical protein
MSSARSEDRYGAHASAEQQIAHRYPPCDSTAGERRDSTRCAASRHPFDLSGLRPTRLSRIRQDTRVPTFLKPELKRKSIAATNLRNEKIASGWVQLSRVYVFLRGTVDAIYTKDIPCSYGPKESDYGLECSDPYRDLHWAGDQRLPAGRVLI